MPSESIKAPLGGYMHSEYAASLREFGKPLHLSRSDGWVLKRPIPNTSVYDAMGCYPLFSCKRWERLAEDLDELGEKVVAFSAVIDPFRLCDPQALRTLFPDVCKTFKMHYLIDLKSPDGITYSKHHLRNARYALKHLSIKPVSNPQGALNDWQRLYDVLKDRHNIQGVNAFSRSAFLKQFSVPGFVAFEALHNGQVVGMILWYVDGERAYYHLGAYDETGYQLKASFALFQYAIDYFFSEGITCLNLGAGSGIAPDPLNGLDRFKSGWANGRMPVYFVGRIFDAESYLMLKNETNNKNSEFFPAYRTGEYS